MYNELKDKSEIIKITEGKDIKKSFIFLDNNLMKINIEKKIEKELKKNSLVKIKTFEEYKDYPRLLQIKKNKKTVEYFCYPVEIEKRVERYLNILKEAGLKEETYLIIYKKKKEIALSIYQSNKMIKKEEEVEIYEDNIILVISVIDKILENIYYNNIK